MKRRTRAELSARIEEALARLAETRAAVAERGAEAPGAGDLFVCPATAEHPVEWAVVDRDPQDPARLWAVPADTRSLVGPSDVEVPATGAGGPLTLRCGFGVSVAADLLPPEHRTGRLDEAVLAVARRQRAAIAGRASSHRALEASTLEIEVANDPEYQLWLEEVVVPARAALAALAADSPAEVLAFKAPPRRRGAPSGSRPRGGSLALAASVLLAVGLGGAAMWQQQQIADLEGRLQTAGGREPLVNLPVGWLAPREEIRGTVETLRVPASARYFLVVLEVPDPEPYPEYRLEIHDQAAEVWSSPVAKTGITEVTVAFPRGLLPGGEYRLVLEGLRDGRATVVAEYRMRLELE